MYNLKQISKTPHINRFQLKILLPLYIISNFFANINEIPKSEFRNPKYHLTLPPYHL